MSVRQLGQSTDCLLVCLTVPLVDNMCCRLLLLLLLSVKAVEWFYYSITEFDLLLLLLLLRREQDKVGVGGGLPFWVMIIVYDV